MNINDLMARDIREDEERTRRALARAVEHRERRTAREDAWILAVIAIAVAFADAARNAKAAEAEVVEVPADPLALPAPDPVQEAIDNADGDIKPKTKKSGKGKGGKKTGKKKGGK